MRENYLIKINSRKQFEDLLDWCKFRNISLSTKSYGEIETNNLFRFSTKERTIFHGDISYYERQPYYPYEIIGFEHFALLMKNDYRFCKERAVETIKEDGICNIEIVFEKTGEVVSVIQVIDFFHCKRLNDFLEPYLKEDCCGKGYTIWDDKSKAIAYYNNFVVFLKREIENIKFQKTAYKTKTISVCI